MQKLSTQIAKLSTLVEHKDFSANELESYFAALKTRIGVSLETTAKKDAPLFRILNDILTWLPSRLATTTKADLSIDIAKYFYSAGLTHEAISTLAYGEELARLSNDTNVLCRVINAYAVMLSDTGEINEA